MLSEDTILAIVTAVVLVVSECLPFVNRASGNGILHSVVLALSKTLNAQRASPEIEEAKQELKDVQQ